MIGTPFVVRDEILQRRIDAMDKKPHQQEARDDQGRKHFYGAFTGALRESSVGFKGTVGSREGKIILSNTVRGLRLVASGIRELSC